MSGTLSRTGRPGTGGDVTGALRDAVEVARLAPSVHNTQPWSWRLVGDDSVELRADRTRQLPVADPDGLLLTESCGAALHHLRLALTAAGWAAGVDRFPAGEDDRDLLARITITGRTEPDDVTLDLAAAVPRRRTDRRPVVDAPVSEDTLRALSGAVAAEGVYLYLLPQQEVVELTVAMADADRAEISEQAHREEIATWVGGERSDGTGIPSNTIPERPPQTRVLGRYFGESGTLPVGSGHDVAARYAILHGNADDPTDWLAAGEGLSAGWLTAVTLGLSVMPISAVVEVVATRMVLRRLLSGVGYPFLALRLGYPDDQLPWPPATPRLPAEAILDAGR